MSIEQVLGIPTLILAIQFFNWGNQELNKKNKNWYTITKDFGICFTTLLLSIFLLLDKVEF